MAGRWLKEIFFVLYIVTVVDIILTVRCPTRMNEPINITRIIMNNKASLNNGSIVVIWFKNNYEIITNAWYNSTTGGCSRPSYDANYTTYCEEYDNNKYKYTLQVHQPIEGDVYYTNLNPDDKTTIIFQEPENIDLKIEPELKDEVILTDGKTIELTSSITCTKPTPVLTWIIKSQIGETNITNISMTTTNKTGCDVNQKSISSYINITKETMEMFDDPFTVSVQLSYRECDNIYTSQPTPYFTIKGKDISTKSTCFYTPTNDATDNKDRFGVGVGVGVGISVVIAGVIVGVTMVILKIKGRTIALPLTSTKDTGGDPGQQFTNMTSSTYDVSGLTTSGVSASSSPSHYDDLNSETRENTTPTYQQLSIYQN